MSAASQAQASNLAQNDYLTIQISGQLFGIPVLLVQDVLRRQTVTRVPLAPPEVAGALNLRGRIVTAIDVRKRLNLPPAKEGESRDISVVVEHEGDLYSLIIDDVGDVLSLDESTFQDVPATLDPKWRDVAVAVHRLSDRLLIVMDVPHLLKGQTSR